MWRKERCDKEVSCRRQRDHSGKCTMDKKGRDKRRVEAKALLSQ